MNYKHRVEGVVVYTYLVDVDAVVGNDAVGVDVVGVDVVDVGGGGDYVVVRIHLRNQGVGIY